MRNIHKTSQYRRDAKRFRGNRALVSELLEVVDLLAADGLVLLLLRIGSHSEVFG